MEDTNIDADDSMTDIADHGNICANSNEAEMNQIELFDRIISIDDETMFLCVRELMNREWEIERQQLNFEIWSLSDYELEQLLTTTFQEIYQGSSVYLSHPTLWQFVCDLYSNNFDYDMLLIPINTSNHWVLLCIVNTIQTVVYIDSLGNELSDEHLTSLPALLVDTYTICSKREIVQYDGNSCGIWVNVFARLMMNWYLNPQIELSELRLNTGREDEFVSVEIEEIYKVSAEEMRERMLINENFVRSEYEKLICIDREI